MCVCECMCVVSVFENIASSYAQLRSFEIFGHVRGILNIMTL